jgi:hypothetical protein
VTEKKTRTKVKKEDSTGNNLKKKPADPPKEKETHNTCQLSQRSSDFIEGKDANVENIADQDPNDVEIMRSPTLDMKFMIYTYTTVNENDLETLVDTGSCINLISHYSTCSMRLKSKPSRMRIVTATKGYMENSRHITVFIKNPGASLPVKTTFLVSKSICW